MDTNDNNKNFVSEETPVDDVRRIREKFDRLAGGNIQRLCELYEEAASPLREKLGIKIISSPAELKNRVYADKKDGTKG